MPVRKVAKRGGHGFFPSLKMGDMIEYESHIERDLLWLLDFDQDVLSIEAQPCTIEYEDEGRIRSYTPDLGVKRTDRSQIIECKPHDRVQEEENQRKFRAARAWCAEQGREFLVVTDKEVRAGYHFRNVRHLTRYARERPTAELCHRIVACLRAAGAPASINTLVEQVTEWDGAEVTNAILAMTFHHQLIIALDDAPISGNSLVTLAL